MRVLLIVTLGFLGFASASVSYEGYKVYKIIPKTEAENQYLKAMQLNKDFDFWSKINKVGASVTVMVAPRAQENFENYLKISGIWFNIEIENVESTIQAEKKYHHIKQAQKSRGKISFDQYYRHADTIGHVSGGHINPAVTVAMMATGNISLIKGILYVIVQCLGALAGSAILKALVPEKLHSSGLGNTKLGDNIVPVQGFGIEFFLGFILILVISGVCDPNRPEAKPAAALAIGMAVAVGHLATVDFTGASMNPARSFGSALIANHWDDHWVYWVGPILGGVAAALIYKHAFAAPSLGMKIIERYTTVVTDEKELRRLDGNRGDDNLP